MATEVIMPALGMAQKTGKLVRWLKREGESVAQGETLMEIETDKATAEIEAPATGTLGAVTAREGDDVPVGQAIALILAPGESAPASGNGKDRSAPAVSPVARRVAAEHGLDPAQVPPRGGRVTKDDVLAYLAAAPSTAPQPAARRVPASPKARRLAAEQGLDLAALAGSGPGGAVLAADVLQAAAVAQAAAAQPAALSAGDSTAGVSPDVELPGTIGRVMAERMAASWTSAPHFYLVREVRAGALVDMRARLGPAVEKRSGLKPTYTDLLIKLVATALRDHPRLNASWAGAGIRRFADINIGLAVGTAEGLVVPVIPRADTLGIGALATRRQDLVARAGERKLRPHELAGGTFTLTNLGMYHVDAFLAVLNPPQAAILAVGRIAERVVPEDGVPAVRPTMVLTLSCDHRVVDGVQAAGFLDDLAQLIEEPWGILA